MLWKHIVVGDQERFLIAKRGEFSGILAPGEYRVAEVPGVSLDIEKHNVEDPLLRSKWADYLLCERPDIVKEHFTRIETGENQIGMVYVNGELFTVLVPAKCLLFWRGSAHVTSEVIQVIDTPKKMLRWKVPLLSKRD